MATNIPRFLQEVPIDGKNFDLLKQGFELSTKSELIKYANDDELDRNINDNGIISDLGDSSKDSVVIARLDDLIADATDNTDSDKEEITAKFENIVDLTPDEKAEEEYVEQPDTKIANSTEVNSSFKDLHSDSMLTDGNKTVYQREQNMVNYFCQMTNSRKFSVERSNNYLLLIEENRMFQGDPLLVILDEPGELNVYKSNEDIHNFNHEIDESEPITAKEMFKNFYVSTERELYKKNDDYDEEDDDEDDMRTRVYWSTAGLIKEKPAPSLFRLDEIPDSARPTLAKLNSDEELNLSKESVKKNVRSEFLKPSDTKCVRSFGIRDENFKRFPEKNIKDLDKKKIFSKVFSNIRKLFKIK